MISFRGIFYVIGILIFCLGLIMLLPLLIDVYYADESWKGFGLASIVTTCFGFLLVLANKPSGKINFTVREVFLLTALTWISLSLLSSLPMILTQFAPLSPVNALFEAVSALTTTGATALTGIDYYPKSILFWRALLQWIGGVGIIVLAMTVLPLLRIGGMQLMQSESSDKSEKILPRVSQITSSIFSIYTLFTAACATLFWATGMTPFEAVCHSFTTLSTGGFSTFDQSIGAFNSPLIEIVAIIFMFIGGSTFVLFMKNSSIKNFFTDDQIKYYLSAIIFFSLFLSAWLYLKNNYEIEDALLKGFFQVTSIMTTTGYSSADYMKWGGLPVVLIFILTFSGGCTGSTSGGIKIFRFQVLFSLTLLQLKKLRRPHGVFIATFNKKPISENIFYSIIAFMTLYLLSVIIASIGLALCGLDFLTCISAAASSISTVGPGLGQIVGPSGSFEGLPDAAKWILMFGMIIGRLELMTIFILFTPSFWKS